MQPCKGEKHGGIGLGETRREEEEEGDEGEEEGGRWIFAYFYL